LKLFNVTGDTRFKESAEKVCAWVLNLQIENGAFSTTESRSYIFTHAHCYATEGLLYAYLSLGHKEYLEAIVNSGKWLIQAQNKDGSLYSFYNRHVLLPNKTTDATAQASRIWTILYHLTGERDYLHAAQKSARFLAHMQCQEKSDPNAFGGLFYQSREVGKLRYIYPILNTWPLIFAVHALSALKNVDKNNYDIMSVLG
jgi:hypothetical protein